MLTVWRKPLTPHRNRSRNTTWTQNAKPPRCRLVVCRKPPPPHKEHRICTDLMQSHIFIKYAYAKLDFNRRAMRFRKKLLLQLCLVLHSIFCCQPQTKSSYTPLSAYSSLTSSTCPTFTVCFYLSCNRFSVPNIRVIFRRQTQTYHKLKQWIAKFRSKM